MRREEAGFLELGTGCSKNGVNHLFSSKEREQQQQRMGNCRRWTRVKTSSEKKVPVPKPGPKKGREKKRWGATKAAGSNKKKMKKGGGGGGGFVSRTAADYIRSRSPHRDAKKKEWATVERCYRERECRNGQQKETPFKKVGGDFCKKGKKGEFTVISVIRRGGRKEGGTPSDEGHCR